MNKTFTLILGSLAVALVLFVLFGGYLLNDEPRPEAEAGMAEYFQERMFTLGVEDIGMPIEGFDNNLLITAFPGLVPTDFAGVETFEGRYEIQNGEAVFIRGEEQPISSAERTVSEEGYVTLLQNLSERLGRPVATEADIDMLIESINTAERLETKIDQGDSALGVKVVPLEVLEDSRCAVDVVCIQAGTVRLRATLEVDGQSSEQIFVLNLPVVVGGREVTLIQVIPEAESMGGVPTEQYIFGFQVTSI